MFREPNKSKNRKSRNRNKENQAQTKRVEENINAASVDQQNGEGEKRVEN